MDGNLNDWKSHLSQVENLSKLQFNYDATKYEDSKDRMGWAIDKHRAHLAQEPPGPPIAGGPFEKAKDAVRNYRFPDPRLVEGYFDPKRNLEGRDMLLRARFLGFTFYFGTRVVRVTDDVEKNEIGNPSQVWGYAYRTLQGHFEMGEMRFEVWKDLTTGEVSFQIDAYSQAERIPNFFYRTGFKLFGRSLQRYFARSAIERMKRFSAMN